MEDDILTGITARLSARSITLASFKINIEETHKMLLDEYHVGSNNNEEMRAIRLMTGVDPKDSDLTAFLVLVLKKKPELLFSIAQAVDYTPTDAQIQIAYRKLIEMGRLNIFLNLARSFDVVPDDTTLDALIDHIISTS